MKKIALIIGVLLVTGPAIVAQIPSTGFGPGQAPGLGPLVNGTDFSGTWRPNQLVVDSQTAAGDLADFGGIPFTDAARLYALAWPASRQTVKQHQCMGYVTPYFWYAPGNYRVWEERDPFTQRLTAWRFYGQIAQGDRTVYMDWPSASAGLCAAHLRGIFDGGIPGQRLDRHDNSPQTRMDQSERCSSKRRSDRPRTLHPSRRCRHDAGCH